MVTVNPALLSQDLAVSLVINERDEVAPAPSTSTRHKASSRRARKKSRAFYLANGGIWESQELSGPSGKHAAPAKLDPVAIDDLVTAANGAVSLVFNTPAPSTAAFLVRLFSTLDGKLRGRFSALQKEAFEQSVNNVLRTIAPPMSAPEQQMAQRVALARAAILQEFGAFTREQLAAASSAKEPGGLVDTWRSRGKVFAVTRPLGGVNEADVYPAFQFDDGRPLPVIGKVLSAFNKGLDGWELAHWFTSGNSMLPGSARPVDLLKSAPEAVVAAALHDALPPAA